MPRPRSDGTPARQPSKRKLTDLLVRSLKPAKRAQTIWDEKQPGLAIAVQPTGHRAWKVVYRYGGRPRWYTVGSVDAIGLADARRIAGKVMLQTSRDGHILGPALVIECEDDQTAITKAARAPLTELPQSCGKALGAW